MVEVRHDDADRGCSVTGGRVYRGAVIPELNGTYFYADWCYGWIRSFVDADGSATEPMDWSDQLDAGTISSFGFDADGEIVVLGWGRRHAVAHRPGSRPGLRPSAGSRLAHRLTGLDELPREPIKETCGPLP